MIKQLLNSVIANYCDLSLSRRSIIFIQSRPIIVDYPHRVMRGFALGKIELPKYDYGECFTESK